MIESLDAAPDVPFCNALDEVAWIPVITASGEEERVTLLDALSRGSEYVGLGHELTPLERESMHRFLPSVGALVLREADLSVDDLVDGGVFPVDAVGRFADKYRDAFWVKHPMRPFLQRHDLDQSLFESRVSAKVPLVGEDSKKSVVRPLMMLHPHVPGGSSAKWALRVDDRDPATDLGTLVLLLVVTWWQTRRGNGQGPDGRALENGNPGQAGIRPLSAHWIGPNLTQTIMAGIPERWVSADEQPMWLDRTGIPANLSANPHGLWRTTYARNLPYVLWQSALGEAPVPLGYALGPDTTPVPRLAATDKESLVAMHEGDYARLFVPEEKKGVTTFKQVSGVEIRLGSTEGYVRWFKQHLDRALGDWGLDRMAEPDRRTWRVGIYSEVCHTTGSREFSDWVVLPARTLSPTGDTLGGVTLAIQIVDLLKSRMYRPMTVACEGRAYKDAKPVALSGAVAKFYADVEPDLLACFAALDADPATPLAEFAARFQRSAVAAFKAATESLLTPATAPQVYAARQQYAAAVAYDITKLLA